MCGQTAISIRKCIEHNKDEGVTIVQQNAINENNQAINNQRWNHFLCSNSGTTTITMIILIDLFLLRFILNWFSDHLDLNKVEKLQFRYMFYTIMYCVVIPIVTYARNEKLYKHVKNEISDFLYG